MTLVTIIHLVGCQELDHDPKASIEQYSGSDCLTPSLTITNTAESTITLRITTVYQSWLSKFHVFLPWRFVSSRFAVSLEINHFGDGFRKCPAMKGVLSKLIFGHNKTNSYFNKHSHFMDANDDDESLLSPCNLDSQHSPSITNKHTNRNKANLGLSIDG